MKTILLKKNNEKEVKCIDIFDASIKQNIKRISTVFCDGEIVFYCPIYNQDIKQINTIAENFNLFYDNI